jgi:putative hemolysin
MLSYLVFLLKIAIITDMEIFVITILIIINGFFALSEIALVSSKRSRLEQFRKEGRKGSGSALFLLNDSEQFLSAIQAGRTLISIVTGVYGGMIISDDITPFLGRFDLLRNSTDAIALTITVLTITYFSILFGELVPKTIALNDPEKTAVRIAPAIYYFSLAFYPVVKFFFLSTSVINKVIKKRKPQEHATEAELRHLLKIAPHEGVIDKEQKLIHEKVFYFSDKKARHIMTHRMEVEWIDLNLPPESIKESIYHCMHSKLVCCKGNLNNFVGILNLKEFLTASHSSAEFAVYDLLNQPLIVPESLDAYKVLNLFREKQNHFCIVVNEYGSIEGIITLHDIMENLIGEIPEEGEKYEPDIFVRDDKSYLVSGDAPVEILDGIFENYLTDLENVDYATVAGFVLSKIDKVPQIGDKFTFNNYIIEIVDIDGKRIDKILVSKNLSG